MTLGALFLGVLGASQGPFREAIQAPLSASQRLLEGLPSLPKPFQEPAHGSSLSERPGPVGPPLVRGALRLRILGLGSRD